MPKVIRIPELDAMFADLEQTRRESEFARAKAEPARYKLTKVWERGKNCTYRHYSGGQDDRGWSVNFCWSTSRNAAGYFLGWREVLAPPTSKSKTRWKRNQWVARKSRRRAEELALRRATKFAKKNGDQNRLKTLAHWDEMLQEKKRIASERMKGRTIPPAKTSKVVQLSDHL